MSNNDLTALQSIARKHSHDATHLGTDADGAGHFWSIYDQRIIVVEPDQSVETFHIDETPCDGLLGWADHVAAKRGWIGEPKIVEGLGNGIAHSLP